jgi:hypothetical protein
VVKALFHEPEGRRLETRLGECIFFSIYLILPATLGPGFTQPLAEMSTRSRKIMFLGSRAQPVRRADNFATICDSLVSKMWDP